MKGRTLIRALAILVLLIGLVIFTALPDGGILGPMSVMVSANAAFPAADDGLHDAGLTRTAAKENTPTMVKDIEPGDVGSDPTRSTAMSDIIFFFAHELKGGGPERKISLWRIGQDLETAQFLAQVKSAYQTHAFANWLFLPYESLRTNGTPTGTEEFKFPGVYQPEFANLDDYFMFVSYFVLDQEFLEDGRLGRSDGTIGGTRIITPSNPFEDLEMLIVWQGKTYFSAYSAQYGRELWVSDGTDEFTVLLKDILPGKESSKPQGFTVVNDTLLFFATTSQAGRELWRTDGTEEGTVLVKEIFPGMPGIADNYEQQAVGDALFFTTNRTDLPVMNGLWRSDGTAEGTFAVKHLGSEGSINLSGSTGVLLFFNYYPTDAEQRGLWRTDGQPAGTFRVDPRRAKNHVDLNGQLIYAAEDSQLGTELFLSDGTVDGTKMLMDINSGAGDSTPAEFTPAHNRVFFAARDGTNGRELWVTDGTPAGTELVMDIYPGLPDSNPEQMAAYFFPGQGGLLSFSADDGVHGREPWIYPYLHLPQTNYLPLTTAER